MGKTWRFLASNDLSNNSMKSNSWQLINISTPWSCIHKIYKKVITQFLRKLPNSSKIPNFDFCMTFRALKKISVHQHSPREASFQDRENDFKQIIFHTSKHHSSLSCHILVVTFKIQISNSRPRTMRLTQFFFVSFIVLLLYQGQY